MENKKITTGVGTTVLIIIAVTVFYFVQKADKVTTPGEPVVSPAQVVTKGENSKPAPVSMVNTSTIEGSVMSITEKDVEIKVTAPEPEFIGISAKTPVVKIKSDQTETPGGLADVTSGVKVRVVFKIDADTKLKVAEKIYVLVK